MYNPTKELHYFEAFKKEKSPQRFSLRFALSAITWEWWKQMHHSMLMKGFSWNRVKLKAKYAVEREMLLEIVGLNNGSKQTQIQCL